MLRAWCIVLLIGGCVEHLDAREEPPPETGGGHPNSPPPPPLTMLQRLSGCLTFEDFQQAGVGTAWRTVNVDTQTSAPRCSDCHSQYGFETDDRDMFRTITRHQVFLRRNIEVVGDRVAPELVAAERYLRAVPPIVLDDYPHPTFELEDLLASLATWGALATERQRAGTCEPPIADYSFRTLERGPSPLGTLERGPSPLGTLERGPSPLGASTVHVAY